MLPQHMRVQAYNQQRSTAVVVSEPCESGGKAIARIFAWGRGVPGSDLSKCDCEALCVGLPT